MPGLHLNHHVSWDDLLELCYVYEDPGIKLPVCECDRIHASDKKVQHQIKNRKYLDDKLCLAEDCKIVGEKVFRKTEKRKLVIPDNVMWEIRDDSDKPKAVRFAQQFSSAIKEFAETERKKIKERNIFEPKEDVNKYCEEIRKKLNETMTAEELEGWRIWHSCWCNLFTVLMEKGDSKTLLSMPNETIEEVLRCQHGGQAVGNNLRFLAHYVQLVYITTNLIVAANLQDNPETWGYMGSMKRSNQYLGDFLMHDCDGQTFLYGCRKYLTDEVYMKDFDAMKELCKKCFQFLYFLEMLGNEVESENAISKNLF